MTREPERDAARDPNLLARIDEALRRLGTQLDERATPALRCGDYSLMRLLSEGAVAEVYLGVALDPSRAPREVAIKLLKPGVQGDEFLKRFERERAILARLEHPGIVRILGAGLVADGRPWFAMPFELGAPCTDVADARRLDLRSRLALFARTCDAVAEAHDAGVVHRDLKPANVLLVERRGELAPSIIDFGIARAVDAPHAGLTPSGIAHRLGTRDYMPPEQWKYGIGACEADGDVFSLGMLLGALAAGAIPRAPRIAESTDGRRRRNAPPAPPCSSAEALAALAARAPEAAAEIARRRRERGVDALCAALEPVDRVIRRACAPKPDRPRDARALARLVREHCGR
jgi:serine/threonine protein kinase